MIGVKERTTLNHEPLYERNKGRKIPIKRILVLLEQLFLGTFQHWYISSQELSMLQENYIGRPNIEKNSCDHRILASPQLVFSLDGLDIVPAWSFHESLGWD